MKIYMFYLRDKDNPCSQPGTDLYACTNSKKLANKFMAQRDMSQFKLIKDEIDEEELEELQGIQYMAFLNDTEFRTAYTNSSGKIDSVTINLCVTVYEYELTANSPETVVRTLDPELWSFALPPEIFEEDVAKCLENLGYRDYYNMYNGTSITGEDVSSYSAPDLFIDELQVFIHSFGSTLKKID